MAIPQTLAAVSTGWLGQDVGVRLDKVGQVADHRGWQVVEYGDDGTDSARPASDRVLAYARAGTLTLVNALLDRGGCAGASAGAPGIQTGTLRRRLRHAGLLAQDLLPAAVA